MKNKYIIKFISLIFLAAVLLCNTAVVFCAERYVSEIVLEKGSKADEVLEKAGYNVIYSNLNKTGNDENNIYLGYRTGKTAITGIIVSGEKHESLEYDGIEYLLLSDMNLNEGSSAAELYLYITRDENAGAALTEIEIKTQYAAGDEIILDYTNDYKPVLTDEGERANLEEGKEDYVTYMLITRADDAEAHPAKDRSYASIDTAKGDLRDEELPSEKEIVDDSSELELQAKAEAAERKAQEEAKDNATGNAIIIGGVALVAIAAVLVAIFTNKNKKKEAEKNEK